jgi:hypothetical protein
MISTTTIPNLTHNPLPLLLLICLQTLRPRPRRILPPHLDRRPHNIRQRLMRQRLKLGAPIRRIKRSVRIHIHQQSSCRTALGRAIIHNGKSLCTGEIRCRALYASDGFEDGVFVFLIEDFFAKNVCVGLCFPINLYSYDM